MGSYPRDYSTPPGSPSRLTPVTKWLLGINILISVLDFVILPEVLRLDTKVRGYLPPLEAWGAFNVESTFREGRFWELVTFQFLHDSLGHIVFNSIGLFVFGPWLERWWGKARFLGFYLLCGMAGALFFTVLGAAHVLPHGAEGGLVGASAGIYGILAGLAVVAPNLRAQLIFPPVELSIRQLALLVLALATVIILLRIGGNEGGEAGHLGGAILGFVLTRYPFLLGKKEGAALRPVRTARSKGEAKLRPRTSVDLHTSNEIDRILDKINRDGLQSLTDEERDTLRNASNKS
ncbi:rhomboid family intramembrane serine protease [Luteolibacter sp. LG18]|uniref:rhomboid family intramembrane serine protease n=1 Tax=Luteolibacter sp. LG18 TaxID=2819286 RepID=UPI002B29CDC1|nr:hypothetical protein llg_11380 [Luteolibacter sp. LG18]